jgi:hypothetical protein
MKVQISIQKRRYKRKITGYTVVLSRKFRKFDCRLVARS